MSLYDIDDEIGWDNFINYTFGYMCHESSGILNVIMTNQGLFSHMINT